MKQANEFIAAEFLKRKKVNPHFSLRSYAHWLGVSPAQVSQMITGKRAVTLNTLRKVVAKVGLSPLEQDTLFRKLFSENASPYAKANQPRKQLAEDQFRLIADWYHLAILALCETKSAKADPRWISRKLGIPMETASQALLRLERLGSLQLKPKMKQLCEPFEIVSETPSAAIQKYHKQTLQLAMDKIDAVKPAHRQYQSMPLAMSPKQIPAFQKLIDRFLDQASAMAKADPGEEVFHLNVQLFPVSKPEEQK